MAGNDTLSSRPLRSQVRLNFDELRRLTRRDNGQTAPRPSNTESAPSTIYYLVFECPYLSDFSTIGPFHDNASMTFSLLEKLRKEYPIGLEMFLGWAREGLTITQMENFRFPIDSAGHEFTVRSHKEHNPQVAATLPGPSWSVVSAYFKKGKQETQEVHQTYTSLEAANRGARAQMRDQLRGQTDYMDPIERMQDHGTIAMMAFRGESVLFVLSHYDPGIVRPASERED